MRRAIALIAVAGAALLSGGGVGQVGATQAVLGVFQAGGQQFRLTVALGGAGDRIGIVTIGDGQGAGVQAAGRCGHGFLGIALRAGALQTLGLGADG